jgi:hypothetical protein
MAFAIDGQEKFLPEKKIVPKFYLEVCCHSKFSATS